MPDSLKKRAGGHIAALFTAFVWGCTFISSKVLLQVTGPVEILFLRFLIGFCVLLLMHPRIAKPQSLKQEMLFLAAGVSGVTGYYLLENLALTKTLAANVSVITCAAPFFTAVFARLFLKEKTLTPFFFLGFLSAITGICLISFSDMRISMDLSGSLLSIGAAACWGIYSVLVKLTEASGFDTIQKTQRFFFYGLIFMIPFMGMLRFDPDPAFLLQAKYLLNLLFLGVIASALCFLTWNHALGRLGAVEASVYIYLVPVITVFASFLILQERITLLGIAGIILTLSGLILSEIRPKQ